MSNEISADFPFESKYVEVMGSKIHYIDEGEGDPVLFLHGNPTSSYLWRNIIPYMSGKTRCIAPDLIGMGKSDKPDIDYGFVDTYAYLEKFIEKLGLKNVTLVIHDWGSGLGFHYAHTHQDNVKGIAFMEGMYKSLGWKDLPRDYQMAFRMMRTPGIGWLMINVGNIFLKKMLPEMIVRKLTEVETAYYNEPYPTIKSRKAVRVWPVDVPLGGKPKHSSDPIKAYHEWLKTTDLPKLCLYADPGALIGKEQAEWIGKNFPNTNTVNVGKGLHFIQEDEPDNIGKAISEWYDTI